jgi:hypothetical protein
VSARSLGTTKRPASEGEPRLKPQDVVLALKLASGAAPAWTQPAIARALHMSAAEVNHGLKRLAACHLYNAHERRVVRSALREFLVSGLRYVFPTQLGLFGKGMPTAFSVGPLAKKLRLEDDDHVVWAGPRASRAPMPRETRPHRRRRARSKSGSAPTR